MAKNDTTSAIIDKTLSLAATTGILAAGLVVPNLVAALDKPISRLWKHLDQRQRERELRRVISYMKSNRLLGGSYQHGLQITEEGRQRLIKYELDNIKIQHPRHWDGNWRMVLYDIPEHHKQGRDTLTGHLRQLGFYQLQRSAWIHPFPCRKAIEAIATHYGIGTFISYITASKIDNQQVLIKQFRKKYPLTSFK